MLGEDYLVGKLATGEQVRPGTMRTKFRNRRRRHGLQGRPVCMPELGHLLFQWFVDIRSSVKSRLRKRVVFAAARGIVNDLKAAAVQQGQPPPRAPKFEHPCWIRKWQNDYGISIKHPTRRFKISRGKCMRRTRNAMVNSHVARQAFVLLFGGDKECDVRVGCRCGVLRRRGHGCRRSQGLPQEGMWTSLDEKGAYFNASESKNTTTMHMNGGEKQTPPWT